ncbi:type VII secretion protein EccB [Streptomyces sp. NPDC048473]|uniref:type VII secretion protein EccB n=1 Tax=unclassified Streptomyces TaxID=2593676 RepID=UPI003714ED50
MQTRRDQVQAHQFVVSRLTTGLLRADPDDPETPTRRTTRGVVIGAVIGVLISIGFLVFGLISPGGATTWRNGGTLIVEKGTGTRYLYDGSLRPVRNYASARLLVGADMKTDTISAASLAGTPHGSPVGIEGAPDVFPSTGDLNSGPWEVCAGTRPTDSGDRETTTSLVVESERPGISVQAHEAVLVHGDKSYFLLWHGNRFRLAEGGATMDAMGYSASEPLEVSATFLESLPAGADLAAPAVSGQGDKGPELDGKKARVGQVFLVKTPGSAEQYYLLQRAGLVPISTTQAALALSGPGVREKAYAGGTPAAVTISADALNGALAPRDPSGESRGVQEAAAALPSTPPKVLEVGDDRNACVRIASNGDAGTEVSVVLVESAVLRASAVQPVPALVRACLTVDSISVPPSGGSLVRALSSAGAALGDTTYLVTDTGVKYRIPSKDAAAALGYDLTAAQALPSPLLNMVPTGPDLSPEAAKAGQSAAGGVPDCAGKSSAGKRSAT